jgi:hypothetical protein
MHKFFILSEPRKRCSQTLCREGHVTVPMLCTRNWSLWALKPEEGETGHRCRMHSPGKGRNGDTPVGCSGRIAVACSAVAMQWLRDRRINNGDMQPVSEQRIGKHVPAVTNVYVTVRLPLEMAFSTLSVQRGYEEDTWDDPVSSTVWRRGRIPPLWPCES